MSENIVLNEEKKGPYIYLWKCEASNELRGTNPDPARKPPCGEWRVLRARSPVTWKSRHQAHCACGRRKRLNEANVTPCKDEMHAYSLLSQIVQEVEE